MKQKGFLTIRGKVSLPAAVLLGAVPVAVIFALWWFLTAGAPEERYLSALSVPSPTEVFSKVETIGPLLKGD
ncbi:MAG: hypothetical protein EHM48_10090, partial [Planctomycetaceae bacterium]